MGFSEPGFAEQTGGVATTSVKLVAIASKELLIVSNWPWCTSELVFPVSPGWS